MGSTLVVLYSLCKLLLELNLQSSVYDYYDFSYLYPLQMALCPCSWVSLLMKACKLLRVQTQTSDRNCI